HALVHRVELGSGGRHLLLRLRDLAVADASGAFEIAVALSTLKFASQRFKSLGGAGDARDEVLLASPAHAELLGLLLEASNLFVDLVAAGAGSVGLVLCHLGALDLQLHGAAAGAVELDRHRVELHLEGTR